MITLTPVSKGPQQQPGCLFTRSPCSSKAKSCWVLSSLAFSTLGALGRDCLRLAKQLTLSVGNVMQSAKNSSLEMSGTVFYYFYVQMSARKKGKRSVMPRRVLSSCPESQTDFNKLHSFWLIQQQFLTDLLYEFKIKFCHEYIEMKLPAQVMGSP